MKPLIDSGAHLIVMNDEVVTCLRRVCQTQNVYVGDVENILTYLKTEWVKTKTMVVIELDYHPSHILMAYVRRYERASYKDAGELVAFVLDLEEKKVSVFNVNCLVQYLLAESVSQTRESISHRESLYSETIHLLSQVRCKKCFRNTADQLVIDCGHLSLCSPCLEQHTRCPFCDVLITDVVKVYPP